MDLADLDTVARGDAGAWLELRHPGTGDVLKDDQGNPWALLLAGADSHVYRKAREDIKTARAARGRSGDLSQAELDEDFIALLTRATLGWKNLTDGGQPYPFTPENAKRLYAMPWVREQAGLFGMNRSNYLGN